MFGSVGGPELLLILVIALIVFGPRKLPEMGKSLGKMLVEFRRASNEFKRTIEDEVEAEKIREHVQPIPVQVALSEPAHGVTPAESAPAHTSAATAEPVLVTPAGTVSVSDGPSGDQH
jgi:Tat protein translocase TatB subunit